MKMPPLPNPILRDDTEHGRKYCTLADAVAYGEACAAAERGRLAAALEPLLSRAMAIAQDEGRMCIATVQRKMNIGYSTAQSLCQIVVDRGGCAGMDVSPMLLPIAAAAIRG